MGQAGDVQGNSAEGIALQINIPKGMCEYATLMVPFHWNQKSGEGDKGIDECEYKCANNTNPNVGVTRGYCTDENSTCIVDSDCSSINPLSSLTCHIGQCTDTTNYCSSNIDCTLTDLTRTMTCERISAYSGPSGICEEIKWQKKIGENRMDSCI